MSIVRLLADQMTVPKDLGERGPPYRMFIRDLVLLCRIGVYAHEKLRPQRVRIGVSMRVQPAAAPRNDDIANVLSYDEVLGRIKALAAGDHINLVETLAEAIADVCLRHDHVLEARVMIEKLDVEPGASVGVEIERRRAT
jgi:7,8-dihydroneopterin aldolase/epimerase/oxygenase